MRLVVFSVLLLALFSGSVWAHEKDASEVQSCSAPVLSEATIPLWQFAGLVALFVTGAAAIGMGIAIKRLEFAAVGVLLVLVAAGVYTFGPGFNLKTGFFEKNQHVHADIQVYVQGQAVNFSESRFQSSSERPLTEYIHFHDGRGNVVHLHASGVPLSYLFGTFGGFLNATCIQVAAGGPPYCSDGSASLNFFVNGKVATDAGAYVFKDLDELLISYGSSGQAVSSQLASVTSEACIISGKCPVPAGYDLHKESCAS